MPGPLRVREETGVCWWVSDWPLLGNPRRNRNRGGGFRHALGHPQAARAPKALHGISSAAFTRLLVAWSRGVPGIPASFPATPCAPARGSFQVDGGQRGGAARGEADPRGDADGIGLEVDRLVIPFEKMDRGWCPRPVGPVLEARRSGSGVSHLEGAVRGKGLSTTSFSRTLDHKQCPRS